MKIRRLTPDNYDKASALLRQAFPRGTAEVDLVEKLHANGRESIEWIGIHTNRVIAYIAFTRAYIGREVCGLHLGPLAVKPDFQKQGTGSEIMRFALRQKEIREQPLYVLGAPGFFQKFGFEPCATPLCPFDTQNTHFLSIRNTITTPCSIGYEPEFQIKAGKGRRSR